ncbi:sodium/hydrogen exchanger 3, partial [Oesophagostomum dentatum]
LIFVLGAVVGSILSYSEHDYSEIEALSPDVFFLVLLPPIIFENAYNLNKGYFFSNIGPILSFAILGTAISALVIGFCIYILGQADLVFEFTIFECFAFASMISAVDPVATLAIFQAVKVEGLLYMLVFGESMLNDAVSIVLAATAIRHSHPPLNSLGPGEILWSASLTFFAMFVLSAALGSAVGLLSALLFKHVDLRKTPSLEFALLLVFAYIPYGFAEALSLSGIMAILFCGITMSQYTQQNVSPVTQITFRQTFRTISFVAETSTFAYIGMAFFTIKLNFQPSLIFWCIVLCLVSRALNIFPISYAVNKCRREVQISMKNQIILWFSGMRGAVCFALVLYMEVEKEKKSVILTTTLFLILFTTLLLGGTAMPFISFINKCYPDERPRRRRRSARKQKGTVMMSKTQEMAMFGSDEWTPKRNAQTDKSSTPAGKLMRQLFVRKFTASERQENREKLAAFTRRVLRDEESDSEVDEGAPDAPLLQSAEV